MTTAMITTKNTIRSGHAIRNDFSECSSGNGPWTYYDSKGAAIRAFEAVLDGYGLCFDPDDFFDMPNDDGRVTIDIYTAVATWGESDEKGDRVGIAILMWHRMESGNYEFVGYIA